MQFVHGMAVYSETLLQRSCCCEDHRTEKSCGTYWRLADLIKLCLHSLDQSPTKSNQHPVWDRHQEAQPRVGTVSCKYQYLFCNELPHYLGKTSENTAFFSSTHLKHDIFQTHLLTCLGWQSQEAARILGVLRPLGRKGSFQILERGMD